AVRSAHLQRRVHVDFVLRAGPVTSCKGVLMRTVLGVLITLVLMCNAGYAQSPGGAMSPACQDSPTSGQVQPPADIWALRELTCARALSQRNPAEGYARLQEMVADTRWPALAPTATGLEV